MFCTFCYHGDCHVEQAKGMRVCLCVYVYMYNVCSCANCSAISQTQSPKLFSKETTTKGETPTIPFLWFLFPLFLFFSSFSFCIFFFLALLSLHPYLPPLPRSFLLSLAFPFPNPSLSAPAFKRPPSPSCTQKQQPREGERRR